MQRTVLACSRACLGRAGCGSKRQAERQQEVSRRLRLNQALPVPNGGRLEPDDIKR